MLRRFNAVPGLVFVVLAASLAHAQPASKAAATSATAPSTQEEPETVKVKKGIIAPEIETIGTFEPIDPFEVRIRPEVYKGDMKITAAAEHGASVKAGDTLLQIEPTDLQRELETAENELTAAKANHEKAVADVKLGKESDALALRIEEQSVATAEEELAWWDKVIGPQMIKQADLNVRRSMHSVEDQEDELDQLRKMYKEEELTSATADIVVKRALRQLELSKEFLSMTKETAEKSKTLDHAIARQKMVDALDKARQELEQLKATQKHAQATRQTALVSAELVLSAAEKKVAELKQDLDALTVKAPFDGKLIYGQLSDGQWKGGEPRTLRPGEKVAADTVLMTLAPPQKLQLVINVPEPTLGWLTPGMKATVNPLSWPNLKLSGTTGQASPSGKGEGEQTFKVVITFDEALDPRIGPGRKANVRITAPKAKDVLVLPREAVSGGTVTVRVDGETVEKSVDLGRSDGERIEITGGLSEGDAVLMEDEE